MQPLNSILLYVVLLVSSSFSLPAPEEANQLEIALEALSFDNKAKPTSGQFTPCT